MVREVRDIFLSVDEVLTAFIGFQRIEPDFLPKGTIEKCTILPDGVCLSVDIAYGGTVRRNELTYKALDVLKPLIRFCIENNIMLPRDGKKSLVYHADKISMHIELELGFDSIAPTKPMQIQHMQRPQAEPRREAPEEPDATDKVIKILASRAS